MLEGDFLSLLDIVFYFSLSAFIYFYVTCFYTLPTYRMRVYNELLKNDIDGCVSLSKLEIL